MRSKHNEHSSWTILGGLILMGILIIAGVLDHIREQKLIDTGFCTLIFTEDDGDENYICDDGTRFERDYD